MPVAFYVANLAFFWQVFAWYAFLQAFFVVLCVVLSCSVESDSLRPHGLENISVTLYLVDNSVFTFLCAFLVYLLPPLPSLPPPPQPNLALSMVQSGNLCHLNVHGPLLFDVVIDMVGFKSANLLFAFCIFPIFLFLLTCPVSIVSLDFYLITCFQWNYSIFRCISDVFTSGEVSEVSSYSASLISFLQWFFNIAICLPYTSILWLFLLILCTV